MADPGPAEKQLLYAVILAARRGDYRALDELLAGLDLGQRDTLTFQLAVVAAGLSPLGEEDLAAACLAAAAAEA